MPHATIDSPLTPHSDIVSWGMNRYHDAKRRCRDSLARAVEKYSQPTERPSERLFPINRLPQDVLAEIFVQCLPKIEPWSSIKGLSTKDVAPLLLCRVCSSWRKVVLSVPRLWQRLSIRFAREMPKSNIKEVIVLIHEWITRAGVLPLALSLVSHRDQAIVEAVLDAFVQYASRWEHFHYRYMGDIPITFPELGDMPHLRGFSLRGDHFEDAKLQISSWPMLTTLRWPLHPTAPSSPSIPWHQLTHLALEHFMTARETLLVIQSCPKLTELDIESYSDGGNIQDQPPPGIAVVNNSLRKLVLNVDESCTRLLNGLALPVLIDMTLYFVSPCVPRVHSELLHFFTRSKCKLDRLHLVDPEFCDDMLLRCLEHDSCTSITDLSLTNEYNDPMVTDAVLYMLTAVPSSDSDMLLPNLAHLEFHMCCSASPGRLGMMLLSRCIMWDEGDRLKTVKIEHYSLSRLDIALVALAETHGLKVTFDVEESDSDHVALEI